MPQPKEAVLSQEPVAITDGDGGKDHSQGSTRDDEGPNEGFEEGPVGHPMGQQPLGLEDTIATVCQGGPCHTPSNLFGNTLNMPSSFPQPILRSSLPGHPECHLHK